jgi:hypothetical protein
VVKRGTRRLSLWCLPVGNRRGPGLRRVSFATSQPTLLPVAPVGRSVQGDAPQGTHKDRKVLTERHCMAGDVSRSCL